MPVTTSHAEVVLVDLLGDPILRRDLYAAMLSGEIPNDYRSFGGTGARLTVAWRVEDWPRVRAWLEARR